MLKQVLLVLSCCALATVRANLPCLGAPTYTHSFVAAPESCAHYILCMPNGDIFRGSKCDNNNMFDPVRQICGQSSCTDCSPFGIQNLPHPDGCVQYIECVMGTRSIRTCPSNLLFDRRIGQCNFAHEVVCPSDPPTDDPWITDPSDWTSDPWITDPSDWSSDPWITDPWNPTPTQPPGNRPVCMPGQVFHAHPTDCRRFFLCVNLVLWEQECPNNLYWNQLRNTCDLPESAGCIVQPGPPGPTEPTLLPPETTTMWSTWNPWNAQVEDKEKELEDASEFVQDTN